MDLFNFLFPKKCLECGKEGKYICSACIKKVQPRGLNVINGMKVYSVWKYEGVIRKAIIALKYKYATEIAEELINHLTIQLSNHEHFFPKNAILVPVPLHWYRKNFRGFNQAEEIGKMLAKKMGWKFIPDLVIRKKFTAPQTELSGPARRRNLKDVFALNPNYLSTDLLIYSSIIVFDDVATTGSTLKEAAKALKGSGAQKIFGLTIAR